MRRIKIYYPGILATQGEQRYIIADGLRTNPFVKLVYSDNEADYCINYHDCKNPARRLIWIEYYDGPNRYFRNHNYFLYFKRSSVVKASENYYYSKKVQERKVIPISYALKLRTDKFFANYHQKNYDVVCLFDTVCRRKIQHYHRAKIAKFLSKIRNEAPFRQYKFYVGIIGTKGSRGRNSINPYYYTMLRRAKIVVTCNPSSWEGDYRFFEAFSGGSLVFVDRMFTPIKNSFIHKKHCIYYHRNNLQNLKNSLIYYLRHPGEASKIASSGHHYVLRHHRPKHRIQEVLDEIAYKEKHGRISDMNSFPKTQALQFDGSSDPKFHEPGVEIVPTNSSTRRRVVRIYPGVLPNNKIIFR